MGIFIHTDVSHSVTKQEWEQVYEETLVLVKAFPLAYRGFITYAGKNVLCAVRTGEIYEQYRGSGWRASMDYDTLKSGEAYDLPRDLVGDREVNPDAGDAMMSALPAYMDYSWGDERFCHTYSLWDAKTQGEPYHMYLLAIACLIEDRLGDKAFVYGDITLGQCRKAVELANRHLEKAIWIPARCEMERLYRRVGKLPLEESERFVVFNSFYLGVKDESFYEFERTHYHVDVVQEYWKKTFSRSCIGTRGFVQDLRMYLSSGLGLEELCGIVNMKDSDGKPQYKRFIKAVMDSKLHWKEKNTDDYLDIPPESEEPYSIWTLFADTVFGSAHNPKVDRYIPIEEIREALKKGIGMKCDVDKYIDRYLKKEAEAPSVDVLKEGITEKELTKMAEADASEVFRQLMDQKMDLMREEQEKYDIFDSERLLEYKKGSTIKPSLREALGRSFKFYHGMVKERQYKKLIQGTHEERCAFLIEQNQYLLLRDRDWLQIFSDIEKNPEIYERYYPMVRVRIEDRGLNQMTMALVLNDELYSFAEELSREYE